MTTIREDSFEYWLLLIVAVVVSMIEYIFTREADMSKVTVTTYIGATVELTQDEQDINLLNELHDGESWKSEEYPHLTTTDELTEQRRMYLNRTFTVKQMKFFLGEMGQKKSGNKNELIDRILIYLKDEMIPVGCGWQTLLNHLEQC